MSDVAAVNVVSFWQVAVTTSVSLCILCAGYTLAYTSTALPSMMNRNETDFDVSDQAASWVGGIMPLAACGGCLLGSPLIVYLGRRLTITMSALPFVGGWLLIGCANSIALVLIGRTLSGLAVGLATTTIPVFLGESLHPLVRGALGMMPTLFGTLGIFVCFIAGSKINWRQLAFLGVVICIPFVVLMLLMPESPRWYLTQGKGEQAKKSLTRLRRRHFDVDSELQEMAKITSDPNDVIRNLRDVRNLNPVLIALGLMFFQQCSGINAMMFYTVMIFNLSGTSMDSYLCTIIVGIANILSTVVAIFLVDRSGRKILLYISSVSTAITLSILSLYFYLKSRDANLSEYFWLPLISTIIYVLGYSVGLGPIPWLMMSEILPSRIRAMAASLVAGFNWGCTFVITKTFHDLVAVIGAHGVFAMYTAFCVLSLIFVIFIVPETRNKTLEQIEAELCGRKST